MAVLGTPSVSLRKKEKRTQRMSAVFITTFLNILFYTKSPQEQKSHGYKRSIIIQLMSLKAFSGLYLSAL